MTNHSALIQVLFSTPEFSHSLDPFLTLPGRTAALENVVTSTEDVDRESHMIRAACHCTTVRMEIEETPTWVTDCNCTLCRRYGALWAYYEADQVKLVQGVDATDTYLWGPKWLAFHRCNVCGCLTHHTVLGTDPPWIRGINARMIPTLDPSSVRVQQTDHGHTGFFWTRSDGPIEPSNQPPPGPDDWR